MHQPWSFGWKVPSPLPVLCTDGAMWHDIITLSTFQSVPLLIAVVDPGEALPRLGWQSPLPSSGFPPPMSLGAGRRAEQRVGRWWWQLFLPCCFGTCDPLWPLGTCDMLLPHWLLLLMGRMRKQWHNHATSSLSVTCYGKGRRTGHWVFMFSYNPIVLHFSPSWNEVINECKPSIFVILIILRAAQAVIF